MNLMTATRQDGGVRLSDGTVLRLPCPRGQRLAPVGVRASALRVQARPGDVEVQGVVELAGFRALTPLCTWTRPGASGWPAHRGALL